MHRLDPSGRVAPLYVGKAGRYGRTGAVSANLAAIRTNGGKFARWDYNYAYHMGDLSAVALPGHAADKSALKYQRRTERLFVQEIGVVPRQKFPVHFFGARPGGRRLQTSGPRSKPVRSRSPSTC
jgi:hypothetical protein